jgi:hypothetical protein
MVIKITRGESKKSIDRKLQRVKGKGFPAHKFTGKISIAGDAVELQKHLRKEWS